MLTAVSDAEAPVKIVPGTMSAAVYKGRRLVSVERLPDEFLDGVIDSYLGAAVADRPPWAESDRGRG